jgi:hypothetical protein
MGEYNQQQYGMSQNQEEEVVEFKSTSPQIPQDTEFTPDHQLEEKIEENLEDQSR